MVNGFWDRLYSLHQLNVRIFMVFEYIILVWLIILFGIKNKNVFQFEIMLSTEALKH